MILNTNSYTPEKSIVITKVKGKGVEQRIKLINKKGSFKETEQCANCKHRGKVQIGLGFSFDISCDREEGYWKERNGKTDKPCIYHEVKNGDV